MPARLRRIDGWLHASYIAGLGPERDTCIAPDRLDFWHYLCPLPALCRGKCLGVGTSSGSRSAPACINSELAELGLDSLQGFLLDRAGGFMGAEIVCDP